MPLPLPVLRWGFTLLPVAVALAITRALRHPRSALLVATWMLFSAGLAASGWLGDVSGLPPRMLRLAFAGFVLTLALGLSRRAQTLVALPVGWLVGAQAFRILVEVLLHGAYTAGLAPVHMTWSGRNFDIVTGVTALLLAPVAGRLSRRLLLAWNTMGLALLIWVVGVAVLAFPTPFQRLKPDNLWVVHFPYVWLPTVLVPAALLGHLVLFRKLWNTGRPATGDAPLR